MSSSNEYTQILLSECINNINLKTLNNINSDKNDKVNFVMDLTNNYTIIASLWYEPIFRELIEKNDYYVDNEIDEEKKENIINIAERIYNFRSNRSDINIFFNTYSDFIIKLKVSIIRLVNKLKEFDEAEKVYYTQLIKANESKLYNNKITKEYVRKNNLKLKECEELNINLEKENLELKNIIDNDKKKIDEKFTISISQLSSRIMELEDLLTKEEKKNKELDSSKNKNNATIKKLNVEIDKYKKINLNLDNDNIKFKIELDSIKSKFNNIKKENLILNDNINKLEEIKLDNYNLKIDIENSKKEQSNIKLQYLSELDSIRSKFNNLKKENTILLDEVSKSEQIKIENKNLKIKIEKINKNFDNEKIKSQKIKEDYDNILLKFNKSKLDIESFKNENILLKKKIDDLINELENNNFNLTNQQNFMDPNYYYQFNDYQLNNSPVYYPFYNSY